MSDFSMQLLNPLTIPLQQNALIEASAGTGKTYTITSLYLRTLLGLTTDNEQLTPLSIEQILVVTFTEAATQEIKSRVRAKLQQAQEYLMTGESSDTLLKAIIKQYFERAIKLNNGLTEEQASLLAYHSLQDAVTLIDEASIFTIHGFCHRCLKQFAFETNASFEQNFEMDAKPTLLMALQDFWRRDVVRLTQAEFGWFENNWKTPDALYQDLRQVLQRSIQISPSCERDEYQTLIAQYECQIGELKQRWLTENFASELVSSGLKKNLAIYKRLPALNDWVTNDNWFAPFTNKDSWEMWGSDSLHNAKNFTAKAEPFHHALLPLIDTLAETEAQLKQGKFKAYWLIRAKNYVEQRAGQLKNEQSIINPDDLLQELFVAIENDQEQRLVTAIQNKYPLAFIDEFQDTDPVQYGIFSAIYSSNPLSNVSIESAPESEVSSGANMILIGDPKQAIYKFRGADIYTYIQAKEDIPQSQHYTLATNWRSHPNLIKAVNECFKQDENIFRHQSIEFIDVSAGQNANTRFIENNTETSNLEFWHLLPDEDADKPQLGFVKADAEKLMAKWAAANIQQHLLNAQNGKSQILDDQNSTALAASDICVLVRNREQARKIKQALSQVGVASVFISRDNVFKTEIGKDLLRLLHAIASPFNEHKIRAACASLFFNYSVNDLADLMLNNNADELNWQQHLDWFFQAHELWQQGKTARAINFILGKADTLNQWQQIAELDGDRLITDLRHLVELLQVEGVKLVGSQKLLLWYEQQVTASDNWSDASDEQQLRLESDSNLVQIATLHASKGLEYPLVFLPFVSEFKSASAAIYHSSQQGLSFRVDNRQLELQIAEEERLAEDLRLLYVAMTRPIFKLVVGVVNILEAKGRAQSPAFVKTALGQLLIGQQNSDNQVVNNELLQNCCEKIAFETNEQTQTLSVQYIKRQQSELLKQFNTASQEQTLLKPVPAKLVFEPFQHTVPEHWKMLSYSALASHHSHTSNNELWLPGVSDESDSIDTDEPAQNIASQFSFPKGANAGSCLHWILENLEFTAPVHTQQDIVQQGLERYGIEESWLDVVSNWMQDVLNSQIVDFKLADLTSEQKLVEMEFYFNFEHLTAEHLNNALLMSGIEQTQVNELVLAGNSHLTGVLKGFIDLTINLDGKYYVLDYKSNFLGDDVTDYEPSKLATAMSEHSYQLQALLYVLAMHRWLKQGLESYDYNKHIGGGLYLFLRGMTEKSPVETGVYHIGFKREVIEYLDNALLGVGNVDVNSTVVKAKKASQVDKPIDDNEQMGFEF